jgi:subtilisin-like proprotein convertase family protein
MRKIQTIAMILVAAVLALGAALAYAQVSVPSTNVPVPIPDNPGPPAVSTLNFPISTTNGVTDADVSWSVTHTFDADLEFSLGSPAVGLTLVFGDCGGGSNDFINTIISDQGAPPDCSTAGPPFTGTFQGSSGGIPNPTAMAAFNGAAQQMGTWTLSILDDSALDTGTLTAWSLTLNGPPPLPVELMNVDVK